MSAMHYVHSLRRLTCVLALAGTMCGAVVQLTAHAADPWFGVALPGTLSDPTKPVLNFENAIPPLPALTGQSTLQTSDDQLLSGSAIQADTKRIIGFSLESRSAGDTLWGRISGMPGLHRTMEWVVDQFRDAGISDARVEDFQCQLWWPKAWEVRVLGNSAFGDGSQDVILESAFAQNSASPAGADGTLTAPLIYVGHGTAADLAGREIAGKVAVLHVRPDPSLFSAPERGVPGQLLSQGAAAVISVIESPANMHYFDGRFGGRGAVGQAGPCFTVGGKDGFFLEQVIGEAAKAGKLADLKVKLKHQSETKNGLTTANAVGILPGKSKKNIVINAHADGFFQGADDNAGGLATMVALARYFARQPREHTLVFVASAGHHSPGNGPNEFIRRHADLLQDTILVLNIEHVAYSGLSKGSSGQRDNFGNQLVPNVAEGPKKVGVSNQAPFLLDLWRTGTGRFGIVTSQVIDNGVPGEGTAYARLGRPTTQMIGSSVFYHSSGDVLELLPVPGLERSARFHAWFIQEVDSADEAKLAASRDAR